MRARAALAPLLLLLGGAAVVAAAGLARASSRPGAANAPSPARALRPSTAPASAYFEPAFLRRSEEYNRTRILLALNGRAIRWATYITLLLAPLLPRLGARLARRFPGRENLRGLVLAWVMLLVAFATVLPISFASGFWLDHRYGLSRQSVAGWLADAGKGLLLSGLVSSLLTVLWFLLRRRLPRGGWAVFAASAVLLSAAATLLTPVIVDPLFNRFHPLQDAPLRRDLVAMARKEGIRLEQVLVMEASAKTIRENAYFTGLGRTKRVVLWDNLLENASPDEARQVFAHELGHWSRGHIVKGLALSAAVIPLVCGLLWWLHGWLAPRGRLGLAGPADPAGIPLVWLLLSLALFLSNPLANAVSRSFEREADRVALDLTRDPGTFIEGKRRSAVVNLSWVDPPQVWKWLFWTHPSTIERIHAAEAWRARHAPAAEES